MSIQLTTEERAFVAALGDGRPGVAPHRLARAIWRLGRRVQEQQPELLEDELAAMDREALERRSGQRRAGR